MSKVLVFDFDGTLANSFVILIETFEEIAARKEKLTKEEIQKLRGLPLKDILHYLRIKKWQIPKLLIKGRKAIAVKIVDIKPFVGIVQMLKALNKDGYKIYVLSTNGTENISEFLKANKMDAYVVKVYGDIGLRKSSAIKKLIKKEKIDKADCVYIGDEVRDIEAARKSGIRILSVGWGFNHAPALKSHNPDEFADTPIELIKVLNRLNS
jgi:phosphoglycolate phosphatase